MPDWLIMGDLNYPEQARTYDTTRSANRDVVQLLLRFLGPAEGRTVLDVAGGTGNYAAALLGAGFRPIVVDREPAMIVRSVGKTGNGRQVLGDAHRLPVRDGAVDVVMCISALHQFADQRAALSEARRVIRGGPFVLQVFTMENLIPAIAFDYFPGSEPAPGMHHPSAAVESALLEVGFSRVEADTFVYTDVTDATLHALHVAPEYLIDEELLRNTSFYQQLSSGSRRAGLAALRRDHETGRLAERVEEGLRLAAIHGHGTVFAAWP